MAGNLPWSVKGISSEERELAKLAARRAGVPIGRWLSEQIRSAANGGSSQASGPAPHTAAPIGAHAADAPQGVAHATASQAPASQAPASQASEDGRGRRFGFGGFAQAAGEPPVPWRAPSRPAAPRSADEVSGGGVPAAGYPAPRTMPEIDPARVSKLERDVRTLRDLETRVEALQGVERRLGGLSQRLQQLAERVDDIEGRVTSRADVRRDTESDRPAPEAVIPKDFLARVSGIETDVEELKSRPIGGDGDTVTPVTAPIERAVKRLSERLQRVEETTLTEDRPRRSVFSRLFRRRR